jgi:hypothetical protein
MSKAILRLMAMKPFPGKAIFVLLMQKEKD